MAQYALKLRSGRPSVSIPLVVPENAKMLEYCYEKIGCSCIEIVYPERLGHPYCLIVDEEGKLIDKPEVNFLASVLYGADRHGDVICGHALILKIVETPEGVDISFLDEEDLNAIQKIIEKRLK